jgi:ATP-dependent helicase/nuclease subunit B
VRLAYAATQLERSRQAWRTPDVRPLRAWLERESFRAAEAGASSARPLRPPEEWLLWREATAEATRDTEWSLGDHLAEPLRRAARVMADWHIPDSVLEAADTPEGDVLSRALRRLEERCRAARAAPSHELAARLRSWTPDRPAAFAGFTEATPARRTLAESWAQRSVASAQAGEDLLAERVAAAEGAAYVSRASDAIEELELAAEWCRSKLVGDAQARLLVVIPDLPRRGAEAQRVLAQALEPHRVLAVMDGPPASRVLAVEGGERLSSSPLVRHALTTLRFLAGTLEFEALSEWLRASFWRAPADAERAQLDAWLRCTLRIEVTAPDLGRALEAVPGALSVGAKALDEALRAAARVLGPLEERAPPAEWARRFDEALGAAGWPGVRSLSSAELQTRARFAELLADFLSLGVHLGHLSGYRAVHLFEALAERTVFAPASGDAAVTLTSALEDPVVHYDGIWVAGLHADAWPPPVSIDPFIPLAAQRRAGIPSASALGTASRARELLARWRRSTPELNLSWPAWGEERAYLASPLLAAFPQREPRRALERFSPLERTIRRARRIERFEDEAGEPWPARLPLPGGVRALEHQARCPFRAYAELRLACVPIETPRPGIDPRERGRFLHRALELLWQRLADSSRLEAAHRRGELPRSIELSVAQAAEERLRARHPAIPGSSAMPAGEVPPAALSPGALPAAELALRAQWQRERARAVRLLSQLLALERERPPFRVLALERSARLELGGALMDVRIDRIDELADGGRVIFDYKTGRPALPDWLAERITDPQLPAYLLAAGERAVAIATVGLSEQGVAYRGLADRAGRLPQIEPLERESPPGQSGAGSAELDAWRTQLGRWRAALEHLAGEFLSGAAAVHPVAEACRRCHLQVFCRIAEIDASRESADARPA